MIAFALSCRAVAYTFRVSVLVPHLRAAASCIAAGAMRQPAAFSFAQTDATPLAGRTILQIIPELDAGGAERTTVDIADGPRPQRRARAGGDGGRPAGRRIAGEGRHLDPLPGRDQEPAAMAPTCGGSRDLPRRGRRSRPCPLARAGLGGAGRARRAAFPS